MGYMIDRQRALRDTEIVAVLRVRRPDGRRGGRVLLSDGSLYETLTRPKTFARKVGALNGQALSQI
ncbi:MAG: hypothetical protein HYY91_03825 [Candidatus Omnitrophica bacterium]|nr:hypothetical protein [Candidatus Omnitrophota bacterium]